MNRSSVSILVTGASGFVGSHLAEALVARGHRVRCMVRPSSDLEYIRHLPVEWAYADISAPEGLRQACRGVDVICHCAALTRAMDEESFQRINADGTRALAQTAIESAPNLQRFLYVSSQAAAGPSQAAGDFLDESCPPRPITWYGKSKRAAEQTLLSLNANFPVTIVRPAPIFGPRDRDFFTYFDLVNRRLELKLGKSERKVSLIYISDLIDLILLALDSQAAVGETYFGCAEPTSYEELSAAIARALDKRTVRITLPVSLLTAIELGAKFQERITGQPALLNGQRIIDMRRPFWLCSGEKAWKQLGFRPRFDLETAVQQTAEWYLDNKWL